ncbi:hypothetical protein QA600_12585 [Natronococcus sp. A-GB1]|uniref:HalOD1 output domain-containing protein n=1 Tax=Natronococcus sp. A-GB1 TaxID=3037648 RepID=UPI00242023DA|nr:HalOD1 output domain-containing protein [Natronococcus sp. A-GB1]MDG5760175.1 hypothetical protein [Natronococcus sp. A-GB1]
MEQQQSSHCYQIGEKEIIVAFTDAVASVQEKSVDELPPLYEWVDGEALASLLNHQSDVRICFEYAGTEVEATQNMICVHPQEPS